MNPKREVSGLGLDGLKEVVFNGSLRGGAFRGGGKAAEVPNIGESGSSPFVVPLTVGTSWCWQSGRFGVRGS